MAYRSDVNARDKGGAIVAVIARPCGAAVRAAEPVGQDRSCATRKARCSVFDLAKSAAAAAATAAAAQQPKPKEKEGGSAPKNIRSEATPVVAPKPRIETPPVQKIVASNTPRQGTAPTQGRRRTCAGPGTGAGGRAPAPAAARAATARAAAATMAWPSRRTSPLRC